MTSMAQQGFVFRKGDSWFLRYRHDVDVDGVIVRKQKCERLADYCDRYRCKRDLDDLVQEKNGRRPTGRQMPPFFGSVCDLC